MISATKSINTVRESSTVIPATQHWHQLHYPQQNIYIISALDLRIKVVCGSANEKIQSSFTIQISSWILVPLRHIHKIIITTPVNVCYSTKCTMAHFRSKSLLSFTLNMCLSASTLADATSRKFLNCIWTEWGKSCSVQQNINCSAGTEVYTIFVQKCSNGRLTNTKYI